MPGRLFLIPDVIGHLFRRSHCSAVGRGFRLSGRNEGGLTGLAGIVALQPHGLAHPFVTGVDLDLEAAEVAVVVEEEPVVNVAFLRCGAKGVVHHAPLLGVPAYGVIVQNLEDALTGNVGNVGVLCHPLAQRAPGLSAGTDAQLHFKTIHGHTVLHCYAELLGTVTAQLHVVLIDTFRGSVCHDAHGVYPVLSQHFQELAQLLCCVRVLKIRVLIVRLVPAEMQRCLLDIRGISGGLLGRS